MIYGLSMIAGCGDDAGGSQPTETATSGTTPSFTPTTTQGVTEPEPESTLVPTAVQASPTPMPGQELSGSPTAAASIPTYGYRIVNTFPHDPNAYTQGLEFVDGVLYEGTGLRGESSLRKVDLQTGEVLQVHELDETYFGEGITVINDRIIQLTWKSQTAFVYDRETFEPLQEFHYDTEGWGLTHDGSRLIMSDGTNVLYFRDPETFDVTGHVEVYDDQGPVVNLNELEYINGEIYANVYQTDTIVRIDPSTGRVVSRIDLTGLLSREDEITDQAGVLNGIAYDSATDRIFVTGKLWPHLFEIELVPEG